LKKGGDGHVGTLRNYISFDEVVVVWDNGKEKIKLNLFLDYVNNRCNISNSKKYCFNSI